MSAILAYQFIIKMVISGIQCAFVHCRNRNTITTFNDHKKNRSIDLNFNYFTFDFYKIEKLWQKAHRNDGKRCCKRQ